MSRTISMSEHGWPQPLRTGALLLLSATLTGRAQTWISEVLFNPPGSDQTNQYVELRGRPNTVLSNGTCFVAVNGDAEANPGTVCNIFDLSGRAIGGNGFLVLAQKGTPYAANPFATWLANTNGPGWGSGSSSSIGHRGRNGATTLPHASVTFLLVQTTNPPAIDDDIDPSDTGQAGGPVWAGWRVLDSVGVLDNDGAGDIAYGAINFRHDSPPGNGASAAGTIVPIVFTPSYVARSGNTTSYAASSWVAGDNLQGAAPNWFLSDADTAPSLYDGEPLDHLGGPNFGAAPLNGVVVATPREGLQNREGGPSTSYRLGLNTAPSGVVTVRVTADSPLQVSTDNGSTWGATRTLNFASSNLQTIKVRALDDNTLDTTPHWRALRHAITATGDPSHYPVSAPGPVVQVALTDGEFLLLNELKVNPPGTNEAPWQYVEIRGNPNTLLTNVYFLSVEGSRSQNPGKAKLSVNLSSVRLGSSGLLVLGATSNPYDVAAGTTYVGQPRFDDPAGALGHGTRSFLLVSSPSNIVEGTDLDHGDNGTLEGLPEGTTILDSVAFWDGDTNDVLYSSAALALPGARPDAAVRFPTNNTPCSAAAWFWGDLSGTTGDSLLFDSAALGTNFPAGAVLTPGQVNDISISIVGVGPLSGVIGDPTNPGLTFTVGDVNSPDPSVLTVTATSANPAVVPDTNLTIVAAAGGARTLYLDPIGVGFSTITLTVSNGSRLGQISFPYAASAMGRPGGIFPTGASDASTADALDADYMLVGDDEAPIVRLYDRHRSGPPIRQFDFRADLNVSEQEGGEVDIEASTRAGNRLFWMGSHSHSNLAQNRTNRMRFFATDLVGAGRDAQLVFVGFYPYLKDDLIAWDSSNGHGRGADYYGLALSAADNVNPKTPFGFNIEGLAMAPGSTNAAYVAFRAPIVPPTNRTYALIVPVLNFASLAAQGGPRGSCLFGQPIELDLYGRGIRSLEGTTNGYLISAGNPSDGPSPYPLDFKLYTWTGLPDDQPQQRAANLSGLRPEGIVEVPPPPWTNETQVQLVSDLGSAILYDDDVQNKHEPYPAFKKSRADWVRLGPVVKPAPIILSTRVMPTGFTLTWRSLKGLTYGVQRTTDLNAATWMDLPADVTASGPYASKDLPPCTEGQCFYRVIVR